MSDVLRRHEGCHASLHQELSLYGEFILTKHGSLLGAIELDGIDPDGLSSSELAVLSLAARQIYQYLPDNIVMTQYYCHIPGPNICLNKRSHPVSHLLSDNREKFINQSPHYRSRIIHFLEVMPDNRLDKKSALAFLNLTARAIVSPSARKHLKALLDTKEKILLCQKSIERQYSQLQQIMEEVSQKWRSLCHANPLSLQELWRYCSFISNLSPDALYDPPPQPLPTDDWDIILPQSTLKHLTADGIDYLKFEREKPCYARIASIFQFGNSQIDPGLWAQSPGSLVQTGKNIIIMTRYVAMSRFRKSLLFKARENEIMRKNLSLLSLIQHTQPRSANEERQLLKPALKERLDELNRAEDEPDKWGMVHSMVLIFDESINGLIQNSTHVKKCLNDAGLHTCFESVNLIDAWKCLLPAGLDAAVRPIPMTTSQLGAITLQYKQQEGQLTVNDLAKEEAQYVFFAQNQTPFYYNPFVGGRAMVFGVGPIRSGKSFTKNILASHFMKYGGMFRAIDIDPGSEPVAECFGEDGGIFKIDHHHHRGFNSFASMEHSEDLDFAAHLKAMIMAMIKTNESQELRQLSSIEQMEIEHAIRSIMLLPSDFHSLHALAQHSSLAIRQKLSRWIRGTHGKPDGIYSHIFDSSEDAVGSLIKPVAVFNLSNVRDLKDVFPLVLMEIFYRTTRLFEDHRYRHMPKLLDIDEAHSFLKIPSISDYIVRSVRTWGKWKAGISLWSQNPKEYLDIPDWPALRSAASTFFFMADPFIDHALYQETFHLTTGECEAIQSLTPKKEAFIIQRELGISKKIIIDVDASEYVLGTSTPDEVVIRQKMIQELGFEEGIYQTILALKPNKQHRRRFV